MNITCPNCAKKLQLNDKIKNSLRQLPAGQTMRLPCPQCKEKIPLNASILYKSTQVLESVIPVGAKIKPPAAPDIRWLKKGVFEEEETVEDIPQSLILMKPGGERDKVVSAVEGLGYQVTFAESGADAMEKMQFVPYSSVILHSEFEGEDLASSSFHQFMCKMTMQKRRYIFYVLIGPGYSTLYDLEALSHSANIVVNDQEVPEFLTILRKAVPKYEELFGGVMAELSAYGG
ncbi:MAG: hypothetical protein ABFR63_08335 [Thermodesulfobacteriota bacterium]